MDYFRYLLDVSICCPKLLIFEGVENNKAKFTITFPDGLSSYMKNFLLKELL